MLKKKTILIFGVSSGIGKYLFSELSKNEAFSLVGFTSKKKNCKKNVYYYRYGRVITLKKILSNLKKIKSDTHVIICNGTNGEIGKIENINLKKFIETFNINFFSIVEILHNYFKVYKKKKKFVLLFSGGGAFNAFPRFDSYACSKASIVRLVENLSKEYKKEIQINAIAPGFNYTKIQKDLLKNNSKKTIGLDYYNFIKKNKNKKNNFEKIKKFIEKIILEKNFSLNGKTISINYDEWTKDKFKNNINLINRSDFMTLRRINKKPY